MFKKILATTIFLFLLAGCGGGSGGSSSSEGTTTEGTTTNETTTDIPVEEPPTQERDLNTTGTDNNTDGVRDDIEAYIIKNYPNEQQKNALLQFAKVIQASLSVDTTNVTAVQAIDERDSRALHCIFYTFTDAKSASTAWRKIRALSTNTKTRLIAYLKFNSAIDGTTSILPEENTCGSIDAQTPNPAKGTVIAFFNGILNTKQDAKDALEYLKKFYGKTDTVSYELAYNDSHDFYSSVIEIFEERLTNPEQYELYFDILDNGSWYGALLKMLNTWLNDVAVKINDDLIYLIKTPAVVSSEHQARIDYWLGDGKKVVFLSHSHGNLFADAAYSNNHANSASLRVVHLAPLSVKTDDVYVLADNDKVINALYEKTTATKPKATHEVLPYLLRPAGLNGKTDALGHGFVEIYINPNLWWGGLPSGVRERINEAISSF
jgi:hypothetical protein